MSPQMDHYCLGNNVPNTEQRLRLGPATGELKTRVTFHFGFLHVASLFTLAHIFREYRLQSSPSTPPPDTQPQLCFETSLLPLHGGPSSWLRKTLVSDACLETHPFQKTRVCLSKHCSYHLLESWREGVSILLVETYALT